MYPWDDASWRQEEVTRGGQLGQTMQDLVFALWNNRSRSPNFLAVTVSSIKDSMVLSRKTQRTDPNSKFYFFPMAGSTEQCDRSSQLYQLKKSIMKKGNKSISYFL